MNRTTTEKPTSEGEADFVIRVKIGVANPEHDAGETAEGHGDGNKWAEKKAIDAAMKSLRDLLIRGLRMGVARDVRFCRTVLTLVGVGSGHEMTYKLLSEHGLRDMREGIASLKALGHDADCVLVTLDAMIDTPGAACAYRSVASLTHDDVRGVAHKLREAAEHVKIRLDNMGVARNTAGLPVVTAQNAHDGRWCVAAVLKVTSSRINLVVRPSPDDDSADVPVALHRKLWYPAVRSSGARFNIDDDDIDAVLRARGMEPPRHGTEG